MAGKFGMGGVASVVQSVFRSTGDAAPSNNGATGTSATQGTPDRQAGAAGQGSHSKDGGKTKGSDNAAQAGTQATNPGRGANGGRNRGPALVVIEAAGSSKMDDRVAALGVGRALKTADLVPQAAGQIVELPVAAGSRVTAGTLIARLDDAAERIARDKAALAFEDAQRTLDHIRLLADSGNATPTQVQSAQLTADLAKLSRDSAAHDLDKRQILAPFDGTLGLVSVNTGAQVTTQTILARLEDDQTLIVRFTLPERMVGRVHPGDDVSMTPTARPDMTLPARVTAVDTAVDPASGTIQAEAALDNAKGDLVPGMTFDILLKAEGQTAITVNPLAIQWGSDGAYVWKLGADNTVGRLPVAILQRNADAVLVSGQIAEGDPIVTEGLDGLRDGATVQVAGQPPAAPKAEGG